VQLLQQRRRSDQPADLLRRLPGRLSTRRRDPLRPDRRKVLPDYLHYFTQSHAFQEQVRAHAVQSTIANVSAERYGNFLIPLPALEEQRRIIQTLDRQTSATRKLIAHSERQIERIREYRQGLICCAVTRGLRAITAVATGEKATTG